MLPKGDCKNPDDHPACAIKMHDGVLWPTSAQAHGAAGSGPITAKDIENVA